ncbi:MAG: hydrogenase nickel incorporation protein HypB [Campylobacterales bacterium]
MCQECGCSLPKEGHQRPGHHHSHHHNHDTHAHHETLHANPQLNDPKTITLITKILDANDREAAHIRDHFDQDGILAVNLMSSPGSGKTTLLEKLAELGLFRFAVVEGDLETSRDAERLQAKGVAAHQITTGSACHLDAFMVHEALHHLDLTGVEILFVENVGNLVCPASYDVGCHLNVVLVSVPEGEDKIEKYPVMFKVADLVLITKTDLLPYIDFDPKRAVAELRKLNPRADVLHVSAHDQATIRAVADYLLMKKQLRG